MTDNRKFYGNFLKMFFILAVQNIITLSVNLADNIMLGAYSENALSGVTAVNQIQFIFQQILGALGDGIVIVGGQYLGQKRAKEFKDIAAVAMQSAAVLAIYCHLLPSSVPGTSSQTSNAVGKLPSAMKHTFFFLQLTNPRLT